MQTRKPDPDPGKKPKKPKKPKRPGPRPTPGVPEPKPTPNPVPGVPGPRPTPDPTPGVPEPPVIPPSRPTWTRVMGLLLLVPSLLSLACGDDLVVPGKGDSRPRLIVPDKSQWVYPSPPAANGPTAAGLPSPSVLSASDRGQILWFAAAESEIEGTGTGTFTPLEIIYIPYGQSSWGGLVTSLDSDQIALLTMDHLDVWINDSVPYSRSEERRGEMLLDVGRVSEDAVWDPLTPPAPPNLTLDFEDRNQSGGTIEAAEDVGLDGLTDEEEPDAPERLRMSADSAENDPAGDNRVPSIDVNLPEDSPLSRIRKFAGLNGTEGNRVADTEDLDGDFELDLDNDYWEYRIDLAQEAEFDPGRDIDGADPASGWRMYRLDLGDYYQKVGDPGLSDLENLRFWFRGLSMGDTLDIQVATFPGDTPLSTP